MAENVLGSPYDITNPTTFDAGYGQDPWDGIQSKERKLYYPLHQDVFRKKATYARFAQYRQNLGAPINAKTMQITAVYDPHPNFNQIGLKDQWMDASYIDSRSLEITFARYGSKVSYHVYDDIITYWKTSGGSLSAIRKIINDKLGIMITDIQDLLARNAFLSVPYALYGDGKANFSEITADDRISTGMLKEIHLGMKNRDVPYAVASEDGGVSNIVCVVSPGVLFDLQNQTDPKDWLVPNAYATPDRLLNYEVGMYQNIRFVESPRATLLNCGAITVQATVTAPISAGDGAPDGAAGNLVDNTYSAGQLGANATHYVQLDPATSAADMALFKKNDRVTIHVSRTNAFGVTGGVDYRDGLATTRRIVNVDAVNKRLSFDVPILVNMSTNLGGGVYAYVTKGRHIHTAVFMGGSDGIVMGVGRAPMIHQPIPVDDFESIYRVSWDSYQGYCNYNPAVTEVLFLAGSYREVGPRAFGQ